MRPETVEDIETVVQWYLNNFDGGTVYDAAKRLEAWLATYKD